LIYIKNKYKHSITNVIERAMKKLVRNIIISKYSDNISAPLSQILLLLDLLSSPWAK